MSDSTSPVFSDKMEMIESKASVSTKPKLKSILVAVLALLIALLLGLVATCIAFAVEISKLKEETVSLQKECFSRQPQRDLSTNVMQPTCQESIQSLNASITQQARQMQQLDSKVQQLSAGIGTRGQYASYPADSCRSLPPSSPSGYYWLRNYNGSAVRIYCDVTRSCGGVTGGWRRVAYLDMTNSSHFCDELRDASLGNLRVCTIQYTPCSSVIFHPSFEYSHVCGMIKAYQVGTPDGYRDTNQRSSSDIDSAYVNGISLTYGTYYDRSPRQHIWTFAAANQEGESGPFFNCPCVNVNQTATAAQPPAFVGDDYFCDTGASTFVTNTSADPLWDGAGCGPLNTCCSFNNPPWFYKQLLQPTSNRIEMRMCVDEGYEDTALEKIEIYIQ